MGQAESRFIAKLERGQYKDAANLWDSNPEMRDGIDPNKALEGRASKRNTIFHLLWYCSVERIYRVLLYFIIVLYA